MSWGAAMGGRGRGSEGYADGEADKISIVNRELFGSLPWVRTGLGVCVAAGLMAAGLVIAQMVVLSQIVNRVLFDHARLGNVASLLAVAVAAIALRAVLTVVREMVAHRTAIRVKKDLQWRLTDHLMRLGPAYATEERTGDLLMTATEGVEKLDAYVSRYLPQTVLSVGVPALVLAAVLPEDWLSAVLLVLTVPVILLLMIVIGSYTEEHVRRQWATLGQLGSSFLDVIQGLETLLLIDRRESRAAVWRRPAGAFVTSR